MYGTFLKHPIVQRKRNNDIPNSSGVTQVLMMLNLHKTKKKRYFRGYFTVHVECGWAE